MSDDIKLEGENPTESQTEKPQNESPEEWSSLAGSSRERFKKMIELKNKAIQKSEELEERLRSLEQQRFVPTPQTLRPTSDQTNMTDEEKLAFNRLTKDLGVITRQDLESFKSKIKEEVMSEAQSISAREALDRKHGELEGKYSGDYPAYDRGEIEEEMRRSGIYDPQYHYEKLYRDEILKIEANKLTGKSKTSQPFVERTRSRIAGSQEWSPDSLRERLAQADGREFYLKNKEKINKLYDTWRKEG